MSDRGLMLRIYKGLSILNKKTNTFKNMSKSVGHFTK